MGDRGENELLPDTATEATALAKPSSRALYSAAVSACSDNDDYGATGMENGETGKGEKGAIFRLKSWTQ